MKRESMCYLSIGVYMESQIEFAGKQTLRWRLGCKRFIREALEIKSGGREDKRSRIGQGDVGL